MSLLTALQRAEARPKQSGRRQRRCNADHRLSMPNPRSIIIISFLLLKCWNVLLKYWRFPIQLLQSDCEEAELRNVSNMFVIPPKNSIVQLPFAIEKTMYGLAKKNKRNRKEQEKKRIKDYATYKGAMSYVSLSLSLSLSLSPSLSISRHYFAERKLNVGKI